MNETTKAIHYERYGDPTVLKLGTVARPEPGQGEVLVRVRATGVHPMDWKTRAGYLKDFMPVEFPHTPGLEFSGEIEKLGPGVAEFSVGDTVLGMGRATYAQHAVASVGAIGLKPEGLTFELAAPLGLTGVTAWRAVEAVDLQPGQRVLIHGGAGGVGSLAVQLAKRKNAYVIATASGGNLEFVRSLGADEVLDYAVRPFEGQVSNLDAVIDTVGGDVLERSFEVLKRGGVLTTIAGQPDQATAERHGVRLATANPETPVRPILEELAYMAANGKIQVPIVGPFPLENAAEVHAEAQTGHGRGRRVLTVAK